MKNAPLPKICMGKNINFKALVEYSKQFVKNCKQINRISKKHKNTIRSSAFPSYISENMIKWYIKKKEKRNCINPIKGDLVCIPPNNKNIIRIEVKCFSHDTACSTFGPLEPWDELWFLDATNFLENQYKIYKCILSNKSQKWKRMRLFKKTRETYNQRCKTGKRPHISFNNIIKKFPKDIIKVYEGKLEDIII